MNWVEANQNYLTSALGAVRQRLDRDESTTPAVSAENISPPPALETLVKIFGLSNFERNVLLLCAGVELDSKFAAACAKANGDARRDFPTFSLALGALPEPHWSALTPDAPLRRWRLIEMLPGQNLTLAPLRMDERILHFLTGINQLDGRLAGIIEPVSITPDLAGSQWAVVGKVSRILQIPSPPVFQLCGHDPLTNRAVAAASCDAEKLNLHVLAAQLLPADLGELELLIRLWQREAALNASALLVDCGEMENNISATRFIERAGGIIFVSTRERRELRQRASVSFDIVKPTADEQRALWKNFGLNGDAEKLAAHFELSATSMRAVATPTDSPEALWDACRAQARPRMDELAQRMETRAGWDELVLPAPQKTLLREILAHVRQRATVYENWGFAKKSTRGLGISALFAGASGTGKTLAAEVLANELRLDLYKIDLSQVVSKYIGETEKNLRRVFDAAEAGGAILLFDEADALFGKRGEVKDSHDRYANIEVSYLLQRMESYRGLAILTTNMKDALDPAFLRRIRFVVQFPFPTVAERIEIWRRMFPAQTPVDQLDVSRLAKLNVAGGNIRNIALNAAFLAADANEPVRMNHILRATRSEYLKIEKPLTSAEIGGWE